MKRIPLLTLLWVLLASCTAPAPTATPLSSATVAPPTAALTATPNIPTIDVDGAQVPDPKVTNPELFDLKNPDSPMVEFANAFGVKPEDVVAGLKPELKNGVDGKQFVVLTTSDLASTTALDETGIPLLFAEHGDNGAWKWGPATLDLVAQQRGWRFGAMLNLNRDFYSITVNNFGTGNEFIEWNLVEAQKGIWDFSDPDYNIDEAHNHGMTIMANLIWGKSNNIANWARQDPDLHAVMVDYITRVMEHYRGKVSIWNVYNEAKYHGADDVFWNRLGGIEAVRDAFRAARAADPNATLLYNDYVNLERAPRDRLPTFEEVISQIKQDGNLDAIGLQIVGRPEGSELVKLKTILTALSQYDLPIYVTEFSIINGENNPKNLERQARVAADVVRTLTQYDHVVGIVAFPLEDRISNLIYAPDANSGLWLKTGSGTYVAKPIIYYMMRALMN
jgi:GH35 family endo-1,4-beta-xylanase